MTKLKHCPFCGSEAELITKGNNATPKRSAEIKCLDCKCLMIVGAIRYSLEWATTTVIEKWNRRTK